MVEVRGEATLLSKLKNFVGLCNTTITNFDFIPGRLERLIERVQNPVHMGNFVVSEVARCDFEELASMLTRAGSFDGILQNIEQRRQEIEPLERAVEGHIASGDLRRRSGAKAPKPEPKPETIQVKGAFDPRAR